MMNRVNLSKIRSYVKVYLGQGKEPPAGIRLFLDAGDVDRPATERIKCPFLGQNNTCAIYEDRPLACRRFPIGTKVGDGACPHWNGHPDPEMSDADKKWKEEEKKISNLGAEKYYRRWLNLLYPKSYIPPAYIRKGVYWTTGLAKRL